jgi:hypothetical protein
MLPIPEAYVSMPITQKDIGIARKTAKYLHSLHFPTPISMRIIEIPVRVPVINGLGILLALRSIPDTDAKKNIEEKRNIKRPGKARKINISVFLNSDDIDRLLRFGFGRAILFQVGIQSGKQGCGDAFAELAGLQQGFIARVR